MKPRYSQLSQKEWTIKKTQQQKAALPQLQTEHTPAERDRHSKIQISTEEKNTKRSR